jgi:probable HAF family extracellular repeat protein
MPYNKLVLVYESVKDAATFINSSLPNVKTIIVKDTDSVDTISEHIEDFDDLTHIAIVFTNYNNKVPILRPPKNIYKRFTDIDMNLNNELTVFFSDEFKDFIIKLKSEAAFLEYLDIISCNIKKNDQFDELYEEGIKVRYSTDLTGKDGDWILESDNINVTPLYFTDAVRSYKYTLDAPLQACSVGMTNLGTLGGSYSGATGCSADGSIIVGYTADSNGDGRAFKYENGVMTNLGTLGGGGPTSAAGCSADGSIIVGNSENSSGENHAFKYENGIMTDLGTLGGTFSSAIGCSADGSVIVGFSKNGSGADRAFKWTQLSGMVDLGTLVGGTFSVAYGCSADGEIVVGYSQDGSGQTKAFKWTLLSGMISLGTLVGGNNSVATACSADGSIIVGDSSLTGGNIHAFKYENGIMTDIGTLGGAYSSARGCSANGSIIVGGSFTSANDTHAFKYENGIMTDIGTLGGFYSFATGCSTNGSVVVGESEDFLGDTYAFKYSAVCTSTATMKIEPTPITFVTPPVNPQTGDYDSSRLTNSKADKVIRVYTNSNRSNATPVFPDYATYMRYLNGALRY